MGQSECDVVAQFMVRAWLQVPLLRPSSMCGRTRAIAATDPFLSVDESAAALEEHLDIEAVLG